MNQLADQIVQAQVLMDGEDTGKVMHLVFEICGIGLGQDEVRHLQDDLRPFRRRKALETGVNGEAAQYGLRGAGRGGRVQRGCRVARARQQIAQHELAIAGGAGIAVDVHLGRPVHGDRDVTDQAGHLAGGHPDEAQAPDGIKAVLVECHAAGQGNVGHGPRRAATVGIRVQIKRATGIRPE